MPAPLYADQYAGAVNRYGQFVGTGYPSGRRAGNGRPVVFREGSFTDVTHITTNAPAELRDGANINDLGQMLLRGSSPNEASSGQADW